MERSPAEVADYIGILCSEMHALAGQAGLTDLRYLLGMCVEEAEEKSKSPSKKPIKREKMRGHD
jgi:hypothetical protein